MEIIPPSTTKTPKINQPVKATDTSGYRILIVDDSDVNLDICRLHLTSAGHEVVTAGSGREALLELNQNRFDLAFLDLYLGDTTGAELLTTIRQLPAALTLPVIGLTGASQDEEISACLDAGMIRVLFKPVHRQDLIDTVKEILS